MTETLAHWYSSESTQRELSNYYQHDRVKIVFKNLCVFVIWIKVASAIEGLIKNDQKCQPLGFISLNLLIFFNLRLFLYIKSVLSL